MGTLLVLSGRRFPLPDISDDFYWSATTRATAPESAWIVGFTHGYIQIGIDKSDDSLAARCVRDGV